MVEHSKDPSPRTAPGQAEASEEQRVAKVLARAGVASRRDIERLIEERRVAINGQVLETPAVKVGPDDILTVDGEVVAAAEETRLWRYHKPVGLVTSHNDPNGRPTVFQNLPKGMPRVISVGRLDLNSEGLLLLTNDGALARQLELPGNAWVRRYRARAHGRTSQAALDRLKDGITVEGVRYGSIEAKLDKAKEGPQGSNVWISVAITEGKNREVRRVLEAIGLKVNRLIRLSYGPFLLGPLESGHVEEVGPRVIREQLAEYIAPQNLPTGTRTPPPLKQTSVKGSRRPGATSAARGPARPGERAEEKPKKVYKAGWAKPKPRANAHAMPLKAKPKTVISAQPITPAKGSKRPPPRRG